MKIITKDQLRAEIYPTRREMGLAAGQAAARHLRKALETSGRARVIFASAPSQDDMLDALGAEKLDWKKITAFHLDEYVGISAEHPASFRSYIQKRLFSRVHPGCFHGIPGELPDSKLECQKYGQMLEEAPIDLVCLGIGENGHLAFNDPSFADFQDPLPVKMVRLEESSRQQQVHDKCFSKLDEVPQFAITLTIPTIMRSKAVVCVVPGARKAAAVKACLEGEISTACPASILRRHANATLYLDRDSCP